MTSISPSKSVHDRLLVLRRKPCICDNLCQTEK